MSVRGVLGWLGQLLAWLAILGVVAILLVAVLVPRLGGATPYTILTGSMKPDYPPERWWWSSRSTETRSRSGR